VEQGAAGRLETAGVIGQSEGSVEEGFLQALHAEPNDEATWLALADWLEDDRQSERAELVRLIRRLRVLPVMRRRGERAKLEDRVAWLLNAGVRPVVPEVVNSIGMRLVLIPPGCFRMGSPTSETGRDDDEGPMHEVEITRAFYLGVFPVTQAQYQHIMGVNPSSFSPTGVGKERVKGLDTNAFPVETVSWEQVHEFCRRLSELLEEKSAGRVYRLPSEAEWEYACRGGTCSSTAYHFGDRIDASLANFGAYGKEKGALIRTCAVGSYKPNAFGLYDMHGNVWEQCSDWFDAGYYLKSPRRDPQGPAAGRLLRVIRGGGWIDAGRNCRSANRGGALADPHRNRGFRVVAVAAGEQGAQAQ
jgi:uncharacterized protein (TIGR02996 family)